MSSEPSRHVLPTVAATHAFAAACAATARPGSVHALVGDLGLGKTEWTRGFARALGVSDDVAVCSPSYLLLNVYEGPACRVAHYDAYFVGDGDDLLRAGLAEMVDEGAYVVVEWADRVADVLPDDALWIELSWEHGMRVARRSGARVP